MDTDAAQVDEPVDGSKQVVLRDVILKRELVKQSRPRLLPRPHHRSIVTPVGGIESARCPSIKHEFFNGISL
jgi:hypothetical protein